MHLTSSNASRVRIKTRKKHTDLVQVRRPFWNAAVASTRRTAFAAFCAGAFLGCLFGVITTLVPGGRKTRESDILSVNERTGKSQLHVTGKPEIK